MPHGDTCVSHLFEPGAIPASAGMTPILPTTAEPPSGQATVAAAIVEAATATDATTAIKITATAAMTEAVTAASVVNAALVYAASIVEAATAADVPDTSVPVVGTIAETASAADTPNATVTAGAVPTAWSPTDKTANITLTNSNLTATVTGTGSNNARTAGGQSSGKFYFEIKFPTLDGGVTGCGVANSSVALTTWAGNGTGGAKVFASDGSIWVNNVTSSGNNLGAVTANQVVCCAVDQTNHRIWFRINNGNWNNNASNDPATNVGGLDISLLSGVGVFACVALQGLNAASAIADFGATSFVYSVPSGFTGGPRA